MIICFKGGFFIYVHFEYLYIFFSELLRLKYLVLRTETAWPVPTNMCHCT